MKKTCQSIQMIFIDFTYINKVLVLFSKKIIIQKNFKKFKLRNSGFQIFFGFIMRKYIKK